MAGGEVAQYLFSDLDEQEEDDEHKQVVNDADNSDDDVDDLECKVSDLECKVTDVRQIGREIIGLQRRRRDVVPDVTRQRRVLHRRRNPHQSSASATDEYIR